MPPGETILDGIPTNNSDWHGWKVLRAGPDRRLYMPVGAPCNYCFNDSSPGDPRPTSLTFPYGRITSILANGSDWRVEAEGVRNSVGLDWHPTTGELWFTDNGRDNWGDNRPWDELNKISRSPSVPHFGFPFCYGVGDNPETGGPDPLFFNGTCTTEGFIPAAQELGPHVAPLGMRFYNSSTTPLSVIIAFHGSWNRPAGSLTGFQVVMIEVGDQSLGTETVLLSGFLEQNGANYWGRPVDICVLPDGSILISDDFGGKIFRLERQKPTVPPGDEGGLSGLAIFSLFLMVGICACLYFCLREPKEVSAYQTIANT